MSTLQLKVISHIPNNLVKEILIPQDSDSKRGKWIRNIAQYELEIKPTKLTKGQGLANILT